MEYVAKAACELITYTMHIMIFLVSFFFFFPPVIDKDGVFSVQANLSRLRAELTLQANKRYRVFFWDSF